MKRNINTERQNISFSKKAKFMENYSSEKNDKLTISLASQKEHRIGKARYP